MLDVRLSRQRPTAPTRPVDLTGDSRQLRDNAAAAVRELGAGTHAIDATGLRGARLTAFVEGLILGAYTFSVPAGAGSAPARVELTGVDDTDAVTAGRRMAEATVWARTLGNTPASEKPPARLAATVAADLHRAGVDVDVRDPSWLAEHRFGGLLAVGGGSATPPRLVEARWRPRGARPGEHIVVVGKGITFDTGGLNLKRGDSMRSMHTDMTGGAAAVAALRAVAQAEVPIRVTVLVPIAENALSGASFRPGDVITHVNGRTSEIGNTDAEGRLVLADALAYATLRLRPTVLVDIATLTGAMKVALGLRVGGLLATDDRLAAALVRSGTAVDEPLWRLPLHEDYRRSLDAAVADADNAPGNPGGITAALFLREFTGGLPWAHLDIAGPARAAADAGYVSRGATGFGARLLAHWITSRAGNPRGGHSSDW